MKFTSNPPAAIVFVDGVQKGITPMELILKRKNEYKVKIQLDGFKPYETTIEQELNPWFFGNILIGGLVGLIVDPITGAVYTLTPDPHAELEKDTPVITPTNEQSTVRVDVATPTDPNLKQIGQMEKQ